VLAAVVGFDYGLAVNRNDRQPSLTLSRTTTGRFALQLVMCFFALARFGEPQLIQLLISDYERDRLRVTAEMVVRIAAALEMTADELLGIKKAQPNGSKPSRKTLRRLEKIDELRPQQQATLLRTIDTFLRGAAK